MRSAFIPSLFFSIAVMTSGSSVYAQSGSISLTTQQQDMLDLAEELFSSIFSGGGELKQASGYTYRYYAGSGAYVGFKDGSVYTVGGPFGKALASYGPISQVTVKLENRKAKIELNAGDIDTGDVDITGEFDLTVSGEISVISVVTIPPQAFEVTINDIVAPDPGDTDEITDVISDTLENVTGVQDLVIVVTNNTSTRVTFSVSFTAVQNGVTVEMDLEYDYVK